MIQTQNQELIPNSFWLTRDDEWGIFVSNDSNNHFVIQVAHFKPQAQKTESGEVISKGIVPVQIWSHMVPTTVNNGSNSSPVDPVQFRQSIELAISKAKQQIEIEKMKRERIQGMLNNYWFQAQKLEINKKGA